MNLISDSKWETDVWDPEPGSSIPEQSYGDWQSVGGLFRGCGNTVVYGLPTGDRVTVYSSDPYKGGNSYTCTATGIYTCTYDSASPLPNGDNLYVWWDLCPTSQTINGACPQSQPRRRDLG